MTAVWILPPSTAAADAEGEPEDGDYMIRYDDGELQIWRIDRKQAEWIAEVPAAQVPVPEEHLSPDRPKRYGPEHDLVVALDGITQAVRDRGA